MLFPNSIRSCIISSSFPLATLALVLRRWSLFVHYFRGGIELQVLNIDPIKKKNWGLVHSFVEKSTSFIFSVILLTGGAPHVKTIVMDINLLLIPWIFSVNYFSSHFSVSNVSTAHSRIFLSWFLTKLPLSYATLNSPRANCTNPLWKVSPFGASNENDSSSHSPRFPTCTTTHPR